MTNMSTQATIIFSDGPFANRIYKLKDPMTPPPAEVNVTDGGNTIEDSKGRILGHYVGMYNSSTEGPLPNPEDLPQI